MPKCIDCADDCQSVARISKKVPRLGSTTALQVVSVVMHPGSDCQASSDSIDWLNSPAAMGEDDSTPVRRHRRGMPRSVAACQRCRRRKQKVGSIPESLKWSLIDHSAMAKFQYVAHVRPWEPLASCPTDWWSSKQASVRNVIPYGLNSQPPNGEATSCFKSARSSSSSCQRPWTLHSLSFQISQLQDVPQQLRPLQRLNRIS